MNLKERLLADPYQAYTYSYPHKTAYRPIKPELTLNDVWKDENRKNLFLYLHVPYCRSRCSYCNLFSAGSCSSDESADFTASIKKETDTILDSVLHDGQYSQIACGGGTPSLLSINELEELFQELDRLSGYRKKILPFSLEVSPDTVTPEKLDFFKEAGVTRLSMGIQSFDETLLAEYGRRMSPETIRKNLDHIQKTDFQILNLDLIYGGRAFSLQKWEESLMETIRWQPDEIYLYPLYVREGTPLFDKKNTETDLRLPAYRIARDILVRAGYSQKSMRRFVRNRLPQKPAVSDEEYLCQKNGMVGLGAGSRSYTSGLHYSSRYSPGRSTAEEILKHWISRTPQEFKQIGYGYLLNRDESMRRWLLKTLFLTEGSDHTEFFQEFQENILTVFPGLAGLESEGLLSITPKRIILTPEGLELSDAIGPLFYSERTTRLMEEYYAAGLHPALPE